jgi:hypothetical protein
MAGTVTVSKYQISQNKKVLTIKLACVGDSSDGAVPDTDIENSDLDLDGYCIIDHEKYAIDYTKAGFSLKEVWAVSSASPTTPDAADVTIKDELDCEIYSEVGVIPATAGAKQGSVTANLVTSKLTVVTENQDTNSAEWDLYLKLTR